MGTRALYLGLVLAVVVQRLLELRRSRHNVRNALLCGGIEVGRDHYPWMVALHSLFLVAAPLEVVFLRRPFVPLLAMMMLALLLAAAFLRVWVIRTLGERWTTRIICWPGRPVLRRGPYRFMRHPNYVAVAIEIVALPLVHSAWLTALLFSILNLGILWVRVQTEEAALRRHSSYDEYFPVT